MAQFVKTTASLNTQIITKQNHFQSGQSRATHVVISTFVFFVFFVSFDNLRPVNNISVMLDGSSWVEPVLNFD